MIYNADDLHVVIPRSGKPDFVRSHTRWWFLQTAVLETADGYIVEMKIGSAYFLGKGIQIPFGAKGVCRARPRAWPAPSARRTAGTPAASTSERRGAGISGRGVSARA